MSNYAHWRAGADAGELRRVTWVCGDQHVLVEEVVDTIRGLVAATALDTVSLHAGATPDAAIWAAAHQYPLTGGARRLIVVRDADRIHNWAPLPGWLGAARRLPGVYLVFVSTAADLPHAGGDSQGKGKGPLAAHVEAMKAPRGHLVRATMPNERDAIAWTRRRARHLDEETARYLLTRTGGNLAAAAAVCAKLNLFDSQPGQHTINVLCTQAPAESFADALLAGPKPRALAAAAGVDPRDYPQLVGYLDARLDLLAALWRHLRAGAGRRDVDAVPVWLTKAYTPIAKHYDPHRCTHARAALAVVDDAVSSGARVGVLEALVALW